MLRSFWKLFPQKERNFLKALNIFLSGRKIGYAFYCTWSKFFFTFIVGTYTTNDSHPLYLEKVWWKRDGCLAFEKPPFEKKPGQAGGRKRYATFLRHWTHCQSIVFIDYLVKTCLDLSRKG
jgi:hypothetical protein